MAVRRCCGRHDPGVRIGRWIQLRGEDRRTYCGDKLGVLKGARDWRSICCIFPIIISYNPS